MIASRIPAATLLLLFGLALDAFPQESRVYQNVDLSGLATTTRLVDKSYPVSGDAQIYVHNQFGAIHIVPWSEPVVRVTAEIRVGAENATQAERFAQSIEVKGNHVGNRIEIRTSYPQFRAPPKNLGYTTNLEISVPAGSTLDVSNTFGDVFARGLRGDVAIDARFGIVDLRDMHGEVRVRAKGQFPLIAQALHQGGTFILRSTEASFNGVHGRLHVDNYLGSVTLRSPGNPSEVDVTCESGPIHLYLPAGSAPHLNAAVDFGAIRSDLVLDSETWGDTTTAASPNPDAGQRIELFASFADIHIHQAGLEPAVEPLFESAGAPIRETRERSYDLPAGATLHIDAIPGNVTVQGYDGDRVQLTADQFVRLRDVANARLALEGLGLHADFASDRLGIKTALQEDMKALGCTEYRMDLTVRVPRGAPVDLVIDKGDTAIRDLVGPVTLRQNEGSVHIANIQGHAEVHIKQGDIEAADTAAALVLNTEAGDVTVRQPFGHVDVTCDKGHAVIDTPNAGVVARNHGGDIRLIALDGVKADYDLAAEDGNISLAIPDDADALFIINTYGGSVYSTIPITGTSERDTHTFQGRLNGGTHRVLVETRRGNVVID